MNKNVHIRPHIVLVLHGRLLLSLELILLPFLWVKWLLDLRFADLNVNNPDMIADLLAMIILTIFCSALFICSSHFLWHHIWGEIIIREHDLIYFGFFLRTVKLKFEDIKYVEIRKTPDARPFILISSNPLPKERVDKIRPSRKKKLIKYAVSKKLCDALVDRLPQKNRWVIEKQLFDYNNYKKKYS